MSDLNIEILSELKQIRRLLTILSQDKLADFNNYIESTFLTTDTRKQMYEMFDGTSSNKEISEKLNVSFEAVRKFAVQIEREGLIEYIETDGRQKNAKRLF